MATKFETDSPSVSDDMNGGQESGNALKKGPWTSAEDSILIAYVEKHGEGNWNAVQKQSGLSRCGKSCRLRWANHLRPNLKKSAFSAEEEQKIIQLHAKIGNKWAQMAQKMPGRTDNDIKNFWNTRIKRQQRAGLPLYPPEMCLQTSDENQNILDSNEFSITNEQKRRHCDLKRRHCDFYGTDDDIMNDMKECPGNIYDHTSLPDFPMSNLWSQGLASQVSDFKAPSNGSELLHVHEEKISHIYGDLTAGPSSIDNIPNETFANFSQPSGLSFPFDPDPGRRSFVSSNFSTSQPLYGTVKTELPSNQRSVTDTGSWLINAASIVPHAHVDPSPKSMYLQYENVPSMNGGLLEDVVFPAISNAWNQPSVNSLHSYFAPNDLIGSNVPTLCGTNMDGYDPISPLGCSAASVFSEGTPPTCASLDEIRPCNTRECFVGGEVKSEPADPLLTTNTEEETYTQQYISDPDDVFLPGWNAITAEEYSSFADPVAELLSGEYENH